MPELRHVRALQSISPTHQDVQGRHDQKGPTRHETRTESSTTGQIQNRRVRDRNGTGLQIPRTDHQ
jgi:hypothetical protein